MNSTASIVKQSEGNGVYDSKYHNRPLSQGNLGSVNQQSGNHGGQGQLTLSSSRMKDSYVNFNATITEFNESKKQEEQANLTYNTQQLLKNNVA